MIFRKKAPKAPARRRAGDGLHRAPTRFERFRAWIEGLPKMRLYIALTVITWFSLTALIGFGSDPLVLLGLRDESGEYRVGMVAREDVYAPRSVTYIDPAATERAREEAASQVRPVYRQSEKVPERVISEVRSFFERVREIRRSDAPVEERMQRLSDAAPFYLPDEAVRTLIFMSPGEIDDTERFVVENLRELYGSTAVADDDVEDLPVSVIRISEARARLSEAASQDASGEVREMVDLLSRGFVEPNYVVDRRATQEAREEAASQVEPVRGSIQQGERIVARGEVLDREDIAQLEALRVIRDTTSWTVFLGVGLVVAAELWVAWYFIERFGRRIFKANAATRLVLAVSLTILFTLLARVFILLQFNPYLTPLAGLSVIGTILLGPRLMFLIVVVTSINVGIIAGNDFFLTAALLISAGFAIYTVVRVNARQELLRAGLLIAVVTAATTFAVSLIGGGNFSVALWQGALGLGNGLLSLMLAMVLLPLLEGAFNILTPMKLLELSDPGNPLLQELLRRAPGTFSHSMQVGNLAENAAKRIDANPLLARVGAYYHDIGKMEHPAYFVENQISQMNPHASLTPSLSAKIIKRHVKDGLEIGRAWGLPQEVLDMICEHHGTTRIEYFYRKALEECAGASTVREEDFRYSCGRPRSKESGILMLADSIEATVKAIPRPTPKRIEDVVEDVIRQRIEDGQFDECALTMREIQEVGDAIREALIGFLGPRVEYPESAPKKPSPVKPTT